MLEGLGVILLVLLIIAGLFPLYWRFYVHHRWIPAQGTVVKNRLHPDEGRGRPRYHYPSVEFSADGDTHVFESRWRKRAGAPPRFQVGQTVGVLYSPRKPSRAIIRTWGRYLRWAAVIEICIVALFLVPLVLALLSGNK